ncbi:hypothetical protein J5N97_008873 [Dioscorea zingiberensis]|uniref:GATA-type domain-containing protein n=1 Tax=Dioscorea zingiberensis TaxID=325984 RepID=A0A9D5CY99_9LILI|nr:hypothetical protein J5N97_008873 [Dioscorea zingiberensis]
MRSKEAMDIEDQQRSGSTQTKSCALCRTTKTPLWRGGPSGPKSLCNACGIKYRKKREKSNGSRILKLGMLSFGSEFLLKKRSNIVKKHRKLREEEQAAVLLMALSSGFHGLVFMDNFSSSL